MASDLLQIRRGIELLYKDQKPSSLCQPNFTCADQVNFDVLAQNALNFKMQYQEHLKNYSRNSINLKKIDSETFEVTYESPLKTKNENANRVIGYIYKPDLIDECKVKLPATLILHHVADTIKPQIQMAKLASMYQKGIIMVIYLPGYGPRKESPTSRPFSANLQEFMATTLQSLLDIRIAGEVLKSLDDVDQKNIQLGGLSLGALMTAMFAGIDPLFDNYFIGLGGGDITEVLTMDKSTPTTFEIKNALENINWDKDEARFYLSALDPITWAYTIQGKKIKILSAHNDELINENKSVIKFVEALKQSGNQVDWSAHDGTHVPDPKKLGFTKALKIYVKLLASTFNFLGEIKRNQIDQCVKNLYPQ